jgi:hypothetical protein
MEMWDNWEGRLLIPVLRAIAKVSVDRSRGRFGNVLRRRRARNRVRGGQHEIDGGIAITREWLADDILEGADAIAEFLFGSSSYRRKVYYLAECSKLPIFRLGSVLCARKSVLLEFIAGQEERVRPYVGRD